MRKQKQQTNFKFFRQFHITVSGEKRPPTFLSIFSNIGTGAIFLDFVSWRLGRWVIPERKLRVFLELPIEGSFLRFLTSISSCIVCWNMLSSPKDMHNCRLLYTFALHWLFLSAKVFENRNDIVSDVPWGRKRHVRLTIGLLRRLSATQNLWPRPLKCIYTEKIRLPK